MKKVDRIETKIVTYFIDGDFEWPIEDLLNNLERLHEWDGMDWEDNFHWFKTNEEQLTLYLVSKEVICKNEKYLCYHLKTEEARYKLYNQVLKVYND